VKGTGRKALAVMPQYQKLTDEELAGLVAQGNHDALETLYDRYARRTIGLAYRIVGQVELAEEVAQEVFLRFWERPHMFDAGQARFATWLLTVVHHRAINERRRSAFRLNVSADASTPDNEPMQITDDGPEPHEIVWEELERKALHEALGQLSQPQRQVVELAYFAGMKQTEIAGYLGEPLGTIKSRLRQAIMKLRDLLTPADAKNGANERIVPGMEIL
jgi:RNA polymerase sigma-70 factor, ECF subfamily